MDSRIFSNFSKLHLSRFHGVFAPRASVRAKLKALLPMPPPALLSPPQDTASPTADGATADGAVARGELPSQPESTPQYRRPWAQLLKRVFGHDILVCPKCHDQMRHIQFVDDPAVIQRICAHLGLPTAPPPVAPARAPPQQHFELDC